MALRRFNLYNSVALTSMESIYECLQMVQESQKSKVFRRPFVVGVNNGRWSVNG